MHAARDAAAHCQPLDQTGQFGAAFAVRACCQSFLYKCAVICLHILPGRHATGFRDTAADVLRHHFGHIREFCNLGLVGVRQQGIRYEQAGFLLLADRHGAQAETCGDFIVDRHFGQGRLEGFDRQTIGTSHAHRGADHDVALACYAGTDGCAVDGGEAADVAAAVLELAAHEDALVRDEHVVEMDVGLGDVAGMRHIVAFFSCTGVADAAALDDGDAFFIPRYGKRYCEIFVHFAVSGAGHRDDVVTGCHAADLDFVAADDDAVGLDFFHMEGNVRIGLLGSFFGAVAFGVGDGAG